MQKKQYLCKRITKKKKTALLCFGGRGAVGGKRKCIMFEQKTPKGGNTFIFRVQRYCFYLIYANFSHYFFKKKVDFMYN